MLGYKNPYFVDLTKRICVNNIYNFAHDIAAQNVANQFKTTRMTSLH